MTIFLYTLQAEWLKKRRSAASWLTIAGAFFIPAIVLAGALTDHQTLTTFYMSDHIWEKVFMRCWKFMAIFLLPMGVIIATSLATQIEFRNNTWKQLHTIPASYTHIFLAKLFVIVLMMLQFFMLFNIGIYLVTALPALVYADIPYPQDPIPATFFLKHNLRFFIDCLPVIGLQYLLSLQFKNFLVPVGFGIAMFVAAMMAMNWQYGYLVPYGYATLEFAPKSSTGGHSTSFWALSYFSVFIVCAYVLYVAKREKG